jgi:tetratricopeptide (TPR) repeat protein
MADLKDRLDRDADALLLRELLHLNDAQFDEVIRQLMLELKVEPRKIRNKPTYYFAEVVSTEDQNREILFVNKGAGVIGTVDVEKLYQYAEKVRAPRSKLLTLGDVSREAEKEGRRKNVKLINGADLAALIRKVGIEDMILKDFAHQEEVQAPPSEEETLRGQTIMGIESMQAGDPVVALEHFDRAIAADPDSDAVWRLKGNALDQLGHHERALECYARALELNQQSAELWYSIGACMYHLGRYEDELQAYNKALGLDPQMERAWLNKGSTLLKMHKYKEALDALNSLLKLNPRFVKAHGDRGIVLRHLNRMGDAIGAFETALSLDAEFSEAWANKGSILLQLGRYEEALVPFENLVTFRPDSAQAWKTKGELESRLGRRNDAIISFEKVLDIEPTNEGAKKMLDAEKAKINASRPELHEKISSIFYNAGLEVQPEPVFIEPEAEAPPMKEEAPVDKKQRVVRKIEKVEEAEGAEEAEEIEEKEPAPVEEMEEEAEPELEYKEPEEAEPSKVEEMIQQSAIPDDLLGSETDMTGEPMEGVAEDVFGDSADLMMLMKRPELALDEADKGLRLEPMSVRMLLLKGSALFALGREEDALKAFIRAVELEPGREEAVYSIEFILGSRGKYAEAAEALEPLLDGKRWVPEILAAMDCLQAGKIKEVSEHMESAISLAPSAMAWNYKGLLELEQGDFEKAIETFGRAREMEQVFSDPSNNTGVAYSKLGQNDEASNWYDNAISAQPRNSIAWSNRGVMLANLRRSKEAMACFDQALLIQPDHLILLNKGFMQLSADQLDDSLATFNTSLSTKESAEGFNDKGIVLARLNRFNEAMACFRRALQYAPEFDDAKKNADQFAKMETAEPKKARSEVSLKVPPTNEEMAWQVLGDVDESSLSKLKKSEIDEICEALGLSQDGSKKDLVERVMAAYKAHKKK